MTGDYGKSLAMANKVINRFRPKTGKAEYIKGLILLNLGDKTKACEFLKIALDYGYTAAEVLQKQECE